MPKQNKKRSPVLRKNEELQLITRVYLKYSATIKCRLSTQAKGPAAEHNAKLVKYPKYVELKENKIS